MLFDNKKQNKENKRPNHGAEEQEDSPSSQDKHSQPPTSPLQGQAALVRKEGGHSPVRGEDLISA